MVNADKGYLGFFVGLLIIGPSGFVCCAVRRIFFGGSPGPLHLPTTNGPLSIVLVHVPIYVQTRLGTRSEPTEIWGSERPPHALFKLCEASLPLTKTLGLAHCVKPLCHSRRRWALHTVWSLSATHEDTEPCTLCGAQQSKPCGWYRVQSWSGIFSTFFNFLQRPIDGEYCFSCFSYGNGYYSDWMWKDNSLFCVEIGGNFQNPTRI